MCLSVLLPACRSQQQKKQIPMHSNSIGCPKIFPLSAPVFVLVIASDMHLEPESEKKSEKR